MSRESARPRTFSNPTSQYPRAVSIGATAGVCKGGQLDSDRRAARVELAFDGLSTALTKGSEKPRPTTLLNG